MRHTKVVHMTSVHVPFDPRIFRKECCSLARADFNVTVLGKDWQAGEYDGVRVVSVQGGSSRLSRMTHTVWSVYKEAKKLDADIYHFHDPELLPIGLLLKGEGKRVIYDIHEDMPKEILSKPYLPRWSREVVSWLLQKIEGFASKQFSGLVVVTPSIHKRFSPLNANTVIVSNYPYIKDLIPDEPVPWSTRSQSVAYVGGLTQSRAIREMVAAMSLLPETVEATLELAGPEVKDDTDLTELSKSAGWKRVKHHGFIEQKQTFQILRRVRAGLVLYHPEPNQVESLPQKIFEYMGAGIPIIASDFPFWRRIIGGAGCGIFVDPLKPREIAEAIRYILSHPLEAENMGILGQEAVLSRFSWDTEAAKLVQLYRSLDVPSGSTESSVLPQSAN
jgi:hypothetical protein